MDHNKKINKSGSITIPASLRRSLGIETGERMNIEVQNDGRLILKRIAGQCIFCKSDENLKVYQGKFICSNCGEKIAAL
jgi:transcriptional pleiotropic regulator of transition state genes